MKFSLENDYADFIIRAYEPGRIVVNDITFTQSLAITPEQLIQDWPPQNFQALQSSHLQQLIETETEIVLLGTGSQIQFPGPELQAIVMGCGIGLEVMDTEAACRTYNILSAEGRKVTAALIMT